MSLHLATGMPVKWSVAAFAIDETAACMLGCWSGALMMVFSAAGLAAGAESVAELVETAGAVCLPVTAGV